MDNSTTPPVGSTPQPPPVAPPPVIQPPPPPPRPSGRGWRMLALAVLVVAVLGGGLFLLGLFSLAHLEVPGSPAAGPRLQEVLFEDNDAPFKIAVIEVEGLISSYLTDPAGYDMTDVIKAQLKRAAEDSDVKAVLLKIDSPGGEVLASDEINKAIARFQKESGKPVIASMGNLAASGGYYVAVASRWIVANELTLTGSIGVIMSAWNYRGLMDKVGIRPYTYKSGRFKDMLSGSRDPAEIPPEEREMIQALVDEVYRQFKSVVAEGRQEAARRNAGAGQTLSEDWEQYADGRVLSGTEAFRLGFVDELGNFTVAKQRALKLAGIPAANLVCYQQRIDLADLFRFLGESRQQGVKVNLGFEWPKLNAGQLYFLPPTYVH